MASGRPCTAAELAAAQEESEEGGAVQEEGEEGGEGEEGEDIGLRGRGKHKRRRPQYRVRGQCNAVPIISFRKLLQAKKSSPSV